MLFRCSVTVCRVKVAVKKQARREADLEAYLMRELAVLKHFQHENLLQYVGASNAASAEPGGERFRCKIPHQVHLPLSHDLGLSLSAFTSSWLY